MSRYSAVDNDRSAGHCCFHAVNIVAIVLWSLLLCCCVAGAVAGTLLWLTADQRRRYDTRKLWTLYIALPGKPLFFSCELKCHNCWHDPLDSTDSMGSMDAFGFVVSLESRDSMVQWIPIDSMGSVDSTDPQRFIGFHGFVLPRSPWKQGMPWFTRIPRD